MVVLLFVYLQKFNEAAQSVKNFKKRPSDGELLELYALFKQATAGDNDAGNSTNCISWLSGSSELAIKHGAGSLLRSHWSLSW
jgi:hypothetical protein